MSLTFKLLSLPIRTAAKPIGNYIKRQAKEHVGFRRFAVAQAQRVHQVDMRMRLGILHDAEAQQRMHEREQKAAEERKRKAEAPTAIELGANFFSEAFIFAVAAGLLVWDNWRSRRKESARRDDVAEKLAELETEVGRLRLRYEPQLEETTEIAKPDPKYNWYNPAGWWKRTEPLDGGEIPQGSDGNGSIPGNVPIPPTPAQRSNSTDTVKGADGKEAASKAAKESETAAKNTKPPANLPLPSKSPPGRVDSATTAR
ncbi:hypothetical protein LTS16_013902 [Friedmanniomyces endolithicus]|nr:hypothetical protein LTS16_013902 [Friedmanniomyces endolithicus]